MATYINPVITPNAGTSQSDLSLFSDPFVSIQKEIFHSHLTFHVEYFDDTNVPTQAVFGSWYGLPLNVNQVAIKSVNISKTYKLRFKNLLNYYTYFDNDTGANAIPPKFNFRSHLMIGIGIQNVSNITIPAPFTLAPFISANMFNYKFYPELIQPLNNIMCDMPFKIEQQKLVLNFALYLYTNMYGDYANYVARANTLANPFLPTSSSLEQVVEEFHVHIEGYLK